MKGHIKAGSGSDRTNGRGWGFKNSDGTERNNPFFPLNGRS